MTRPRIDRMTLEEAASVTAGSTGQHAECTNVEERRFSAASTRPRSPTNPCHSDTRAKRTRRNLLFSRDDSEVKPPAPAPAFDLARITTSSDKTSSDKTGSTGSRKPYHAIQRTRSSPFPLHCPIPNKTRPGRTRLPVVPISPLYTMLSS
jgi:hypothetical protein